jgi:hypothetical protein
VPSKSFRRKNSSDQQIYIYFFKLTGEYGQIMVKSVKNTNLITSTEDKKEDENVLVKNIEDFF